jgi:Heavy-metal resistance
LRRWWLVIALVLSVGINLGILVVVLAAHGGRGEERPERRRTPAEVASDARPRTLRLADRLHLEDPARQRFIERHRGFFEETARLRQQMSDLHRQLRHEMTQPQADPVKIEQLQRSAAETYMALERQLASVVSDTRKMLTPPQEKSYLGIISRLGSDGFGFFSPPQRRARPRPHPLLDRLRGGDPAPPEPPPSRPPG